MACSQEEIIAGGAEMSGECKEMIAAEQ